jgi:Derlin-2/3
LTQYWRLLTTFIYFGPLSLNLLFHIFFIQRYARMLEESAASVAHFAWLLFYAATTLLTIAPISSQAFLGTTLSSTLVYIWSRRNPDTRLSFLGLLTFKAPWLPWVLIGFNVVLHGNWPKDELCGIVVGHSKLHSHFRSAHDRLLTVSQFGISSTTSTHRHTTVTDRWTLQPGGSACLSVK